jgi:hypothetical protein
MGLKIPSKMAEETMIGCHISHEITVLEDLNKRNHYHEEIYSDIFQGLSGFVAVKIYRFAKATKLN